MVNKYVLSGPELWEPVSVDSLGIQIYNSLLNNDNKRDAFVDAITKESISYQKLLEGTCRLAEALKNAGYKINDKISVSSENNVYFFYPVVAALYLGIAIAPINHNYTENEILHVLQLSKPKVIFCSKAVVQKYLNLKKKCSFLENVVVLDTTVPTSQYHSLESFLDKYSDKYFDETRFRPVEVDTKTHIATILCSSGTTGLPKGVMTTHENISTRLNHSRDPRLHNSAKVVVLGFLPFFHGYGFMTTLGAIINSDLVIVLSRFDEHIFLKCVQDYKISDLWLVPPILVLLSKTPNLIKYNLSCVKEITSGAAPLSKETELRIKERLNIKYIRQGYGLTECTLAVLIMPRGEERAGCSGKIVPGMKIKLRDPKSGKSLGPNEIGEICIKGPLVMAGYINNPKATKETFTEDGWLLTGDLGYYDKEEYFYIVDRLKELIKYKGFQVAPAELEALLLTHPKIMDAAVIGLSDELAGELPLAFVVKRPGSDLSEIDVQNFVAKKVSSQKQLRGGVRFIDQIPKNPSGKILRRTLREMVNRKSKL